MFKSPAGDSADIMRKVKEIKGVRIVTAAVHFSGVKTLCDPGDRLCDRIWSAIIHAGKRAVSKAMLLGLYGPEAGYRSFLPSGTGIR
jgi:hypothetical protein